MAYRVTVFPLMCMASILQRLLKEERACNRHLANFKSDSGLSLIIVTSAVWTALCTIPMDKILITVTIFSVHLKFARYTGYSGSYMPPSLYRPLVKLAAFEITWGGPTREMH